MIVLEGHRLEAAGASFGARGCPAVNCVAYGPVRMTGEAREHGGHARCECGAESPHLASNNRRREWHRNHKHRLAQS